MERTQAVCFDALMGDIWESGAAYDLKFPFTSEGETMEAEANNAFQMFSVLFPSSPCVKREETETDNEHGPYYDVTFPDGSRALIGRDEVQVI